MASLYSASSVLSWSQGVSGVHALSHDGLRSRSNSVLFLKRSFMRMPLKSTVGKRATPLYVVCLLQKDQPKLTAVPARVGAKPRVILIAGPTGVGKSSLSIELAKALDGEVINADSEQVYQGLTGGAKAYLEDRLAIPHHLMDVVPPTQDYTQSEFVLAARTATENILGKGKVPIVVGGTGMDLRMYMHNRADLTPQPFEGEFDLKSWDYDFQCYFLYQHRADLYPRVDLRCEQTVPALLVETSWLMGLGVTLQTNASAQSPGYSEAMTLLLDARKNAGSTSEQQFLQFVSHYQANCKKLVHQQIEWFHRESRSEVREFKWITADASPVEKLVECLVEEYRRAPEAVSRVSLGGDLRNASLLEQRRLKEYMPCLRVFSNPAAVVNTLDWIKATHGGVAN